MNKTKLIVSAIILGIAILAFTGLKNDNKKTVSEENINQSNSAEQTQVTSVFTSPTSKETVSVVFDQKNNTATMSGLGYSTLVLKSATSASGARYLDTTGTLELWNRGETITLSKDGKQVFLGNIGGQSDPEKMTSTSWVWQATSAGGKVLEPKNKTAFTITFNSVDKTIHATTDCNAIFGPYTLSENNTLTFGALGMTRKYCEGSQEAEFADGLSKVKKFYFNGSGALVLEFLSPNDYMLFGKK